MGTPIDPIEPGLHCSTCWDPGQPFGGQTTPKRVFARVRNVLPGEWWEPLGKPPLNGNYLLQQTTPCIWVYSTPQIFVSWTPGILTAQFLIVENSTGFQEQIFISTMSNFCNRIFINDILTPIDKVGYGGAAGIDWGH